MAASTIHVELGFVEKSPKWRLISQFFPSKVGGKPAWLNLKEIPQSKDLLCPKCGKIMVFLLQIYCPLGEGEDDQPLSAEIRERCFHRSVYIFCCREASCHQETTDSEEAQQLNNSFIVFRCQLPRGNEFYSYEPPDEDNQVAENDVISPKKFGVEICDMCGCNAGNRKCGKCQKTSYCCREHQILDWKSGHKAMCGKDIVGLGPTNCQAQNKFLFPEFELVTEPESEESAEEEDINTGSNTDDIRQADRSVVQLPSEENAALSSKDLERMARKETEDDVQFMAFKRRIALDPDQVLRYQKGGAPLYVSACDQPSDDDILPCACGAKRQFEFQIMPQLLSHLDVDTLGESIDWGTLLIYTCSNSCSEGHPYHKEFLWKQNYHNSSIS